MRVTDFDDVLALIDEPSPNKNINSLEKGGGT